MPRQEASDADEAAAALVNPAESPAGIPVGALHRSAAIGSPVLATKESKNARKRRMREASKTAAEAAFPIAPGPPTSPHQHQARVLFQTPTLPLLPKPRALVCHRTRALKKKTRRERGGGPGRLERLLLLWWMSPHPR